MSLIKNILLKNYMNDIYEASDGFFLSMADEIDFDDPREMYSPVKLHMADKYGFSDLSVPEIDEHFCKYLKYNKYDVMEELHLERPILKDVIQIYGNDRVVYATLVMTLRIDTSDYVANAFYRAMNGTTIFSFLDDDIKIKKVDYYIQVSFEIDEFLKNFKVKNVFKNKPKVRAPKGAIMYDSNMVPATDDYEKLAKKMKKKYKITAPVDLEATLYEIGLNVDTAYSLDSKTHGLVCLSDGYISNYKNLVRIKENTILIDKDHIENYGLGSYQFNVLHEMVHFEYHKHYLTLKRQLSDIAYAISDNIRPLKKIEEQANKVAGLLLVPSEELSTMLFDYYMEYNFFTASNKHALLNRISNMLSDHFKCSKTCMHQRIKAIGFNTAGIDLTELDNTYINEGEVSYIYNNNDDFKKLIDNKVVVYNNKHCVINNPENLNNNAITYYAYNNPRRSMMSFRRVHKYRYIDSNEFFTHIIVSKELCEKALSTLKNTKFNAHIDVGRFIDMLFKEDQVGDLVVDDIGRTIKRIREHKNISYSQLALLSAVDVKEIYRLEHNENKTYNLRSLTLICRALKLPKNTTIKILEKVGGFENNLFDKAVQFAIENDYDKEPYELLDIINDYSKIADVIENENKLMNNV